MEKFDQWNTVKQNTHQKKERVFFHEREIWFLSIGQNIGFEQNGKGSNFLRPVLILKQFSNEVF
jgi:mRNA interferase MazF